jgi:hypothetical protein
MGDVLKVQRVFDRGRPMTSKEEAIVRRAFDSAVEIARMNSGDDITLRLCAFFGAISSQAGLGGVSLDVLTEQSSADHEVKQ